MKCFVIMPFDKSFDDVYTTITTTVRVAAPEIETCSRLDDSRPAGRITSRLIRELESANLIVVDLTGLRHNVMWELGYAMALSIPPIIMTQDSLSDLPFDISDMQSIRYQRDHLGETLRKNLTKMVHDTLGDHRGQINRAQKLRQLQEELDSHRSHEPHPVEYSLGIAGDPSTIPSLRAALKRLYKEIELDLLGSKDGVNAVTVRIRQDPPALSEFTAQLRRLGIDYTIVSSLQ